ncbi:MAG: DUF6441 family protein [Alphaproteobacteria bacterium]
MLNFSLKIAGDIKAVITRSDQRLQAQLRAAIDETAEELKVTLRQQVRAAGLGHGLEKAWQVKIYPRRGVPTLNPSAVVYSKAPRLHSIFDRDNIIYARDGKFLAIPTDDVPMKQVRGGQKPLTPEETEARFGRPLVFVPTQGGRKVTGILVLRNAVRGRTGRLRATKAIRASKRAKIEDVVMFRLVAVARIGRRLFIADAAADAQRKLPFNVLNRVNNG